MTAPRALIADDEPLLRERLATHLGRAWPALQIVAQARNGREAIELFEQHRPEIAFLDVQMPGQTGIEAARTIGRRAQIVFVTAFEHYAVQAFEHGALDYLVKPFDENRLRETVARLQERLASSAEPVAIEPMLERLTQALRRSTSPASHLQWIRASAGNQVRLIPVDQVHYLRSDEKYTLVVWDGGEAVIRKSIRELADELDPQVFAQVHRSVIVNLREVSQVVRGSNETAELHLHRHSERLPVSRSYLHLFKQM